MKIVKTEIKNANNKYGRILVGTLANGASREFSVSASGRVELQGNHFFYGFKITNTTADITRLNNAMGYVGLI